MIQAKIGYFWDRPRICICIYKLYVIFLNIETAKSSEKNTAKMEEIISELKEKLSQEQEMCKQLQNDISSYTEKETKMSQSITSVSIFFYFSMYF